MNVIWHNKKADTNIKDHKGVTFEEAATCLDDPEALVIEDPDSEGEQRFILIGMSIKIRILTVCYSVPDEDTIRIISARKSTAREGKSYA
jgi:uncharacterized DUF497 family protein